MISSAVVIPEAEPTRPPSPPLKRRQSSTSSDSNKRPRLDATHSSNGAVTRLDSVATTSPPSRRHSTLTNNGAAEEKRRGQRLFGALLGTLSQKSSKPAHKKRDEIEQRQRERIRRDNEEREEERRRKRQELNEVRRAEQKVWERESMRLRHRNLRATAGFLLTKAEPRLYFRPWELRREEEETIKKQVREVEERIREELVEAGEGPSNPEADPALGPERAETRDDSVGRSVSRTPRKGDPEDVVQEQNEKADVEMEDSVQRHHNEEDADAMKTDTPRETAVPTPVHKPSEEDRPRDDEHAGEELVEGQEDDVIY